MSQEQSGRKPKRRFDFLGLTTYLVALSFFAMLISGIVMFVAPHRAK